MTRLILASGSESRRQILSAAGVAFTVERPRVDESAIKAKCASAEPKDIAAALAAAKAMDVSAREPDALVLGADQMLVCGGRVFDKAETLAQAREILRTLKGCKHELITAATLVLNGTTLWRDTETSHLWMREFSEAMLDAYLVDEAEHVLLAVGCYHVESLGIQLFEHIEGDQFAIRGLPLMSLLAALRRFEVLPT
jgi:septum formation protein